MGEIQRVNYAEALKTEDVQRWMTEQGYNFKATHKFTTVNNDTSANIYIKTGEYVMFIKAYYNLTYNTDIYFYESAVIDISGNAISTINYNRSVSNTCAAEVYYSPTIDTSGNQISYTYIPVSASAHPLSASGGSAEEISFWLLKPNTNYLVQMWNRSGADASMIFIDLRLCEERDYPL